MQFHISILKMAQGKHYLKHFATEQTSENTPSKHHLYIKKMINIVVAA